MGFSSSSCLRRKSCSNLSNECNSWYSSCIQKNLHDNLHSSACYSKSLCMIKSHTILGQPYIEPVHIARTAITQSEYNTQLPLKDLKRINNSNTNTLNITETGAGLWHIQVANASNSTQVRDCNMKQNKKTYNHKPKKIRTSNLELVVVSPFGLYSCCIHIHRMNGLYIPFKILHF